jgi:hypothetical protein
VIDRLLKQKVLSNVFGSKKEETTIIWRKSFNNGLNDARFKVITAVIIRDDVGCDAV